MMIFSASRAYCHHLADGRVRNLDPWLLHIMSVCSVEVMGLRSTAGHPVSLGYY